ncbi:hypothetical protein ACOMHN_067582 [Nucella lapillus]
MSVAKPKPSAIKGRIRLMTTSRQQISEAAICRHSGSVEEDVKAFSTLVLPLTPPTRDGHCQQTRPLTSICHLGQQGQKTDVLRRVLKAN